MKTLIYVFAALALTTQFACDAATDGTSGTPPAAKESAAASETVAATNTAAATQPTAAPPPPVSRCRSCHSGPMSLAQRDTATVAARLRDIVTGELPHPALELADTSDAALQALAEQLTSP